MEIQFTKHALAMLRERGLSRDLIEKVISSPDWREESVGDEWHAFKRVGGKVVRVVVKGKAEPYTVITAFYDRRLKS